MGNVPDWLRVGEVVLCVDDPFKPYPVEIVEVDRVWGAVRVKEVMGDNTTTRHVWHKYLRSKEQARQLLEEMAANMMHVSAWFPLLTPIQSKEE